VVGRGVDTAELI